MESKKERKFLSIELILWWGLLVATIWDTFVYSISPLFTNHLPHHDMSLPVDSLFPMVPWTMVIYMGAYIHWGLSYMHSMKRGREFAWNFLAADFLAKGICLFFYIVLPTTFNRPEIVGEGFFPFVMRKMYEMDAPINLFPSIHCLSAWMSIISVRKDDGLRPSLKVVSFVLSILVCISTLTTRQHVVVDIFAGIAVAEISWQIASRTRFGKKYGEVLSFPWKRFTKD